MASNAGNILVKVIGKIDIFKGLEIFSELSHLNIAQNTKAVKKEDIAYTSASTAENQKESVNVKDNAPVKPEIKTNNIPF